MIRFENVTKFYMRGVRPALNDVSLCVGRGEFVFLVGLSGSGKSTCLHLILREERPTSGRVLVAGHDVSGLPGRQVPALRRKIGVVFQDFRLLPNKTVFENVAFALQVIGTRRHTIAYNVAETLDLVGLAGKEKRFPHELSGGEQQRVAIARAVVNHPPILLADEPTGNLDPTTSMGIMRLLERINRAGTTVMMATHDESIVNYMRQRVLELDDGILVRDQAGGAYDGVTEVIPVVVGRHAAVAGHPPAAGPSAHVTPETSTMQIERVRTARPAPEPVETPEADEPQLGLDPWQRPRRHRRPARADRAAGHGDLAEEIWGAAPDRQLAMHASRGE